MTKRNVFGGGETFGVKLRGSYEWQTGNKLDGSNSKINSYELGLTTTLTFPRVLFPTFSKRDMNFPASTTFRLYADQMNRARFFKLLAFGGDASYEFQPTATSHHSITPFKLTFNLLQHTTHEFDSITNVNKALKKSLQNQFIPAMNYTYTYDDSPITSRRNHLWWQASVTQAGLVLDGIYALAGKKFNKEDKELLGNPFAQFIKGTAEIRYNYALGHKQYLVGRLMAGAIYSYGNARTSPYNEQFYIGGANSIRAFTIRSIGPGRYYQNSDNNKYAYIDRTGDLKFEANLEYRFPILGDLHGATFLDSGNIWLIRNDPDRPGGQLKWGSFLKDLPWEPASACVTTSPLSSSVSTWVSVCISLTIPERKAITISRNSRTAWVTISLSDTPSSCSIPRILWSYPRYFIFNRSTLIGNEILLRSHFNNKQIN